MTAILRYLPWLARDLARGPLALMAAAIALSAFVASRLAVDGTAVTPDGTARWILAQCSWPFVLLATGGMVSTDRAQGHIRMLFSRPISPGAYYLARWLVGAAAVGLAVPLTLLAVGLAVGRAAVPASVPVNLLLSYLLLGGLVFLLSTRLRADWSVAVAVFAVQVGLAAARDGGTPLAPATRALLAILPPFDQVLVTQPVPGTGTLLRVLLWGGALLGAALWILERRPLGGGSRT